MLINSYSVEDLTVVAPEGRCDRRTAPTLADWLEGASRSGASRIIVDMNKVSFMDSTGLATLIRAMKQCRATGGDLCLAHLQQPVRIIFELTRLDSAFMIYPTVDAAVDGFALGRADDAGRAGARRSGGGGGSGGLVDFGRADFGRAA